MRFVVMFMSLKNSDKMPRRYTDENIAELEEKDAQGYQKQPIEVGEVTPWLDEQVWDEE